MKCCKIYFLAYLFELFFIYSSRIKPRHLNSWPNLYQFLVPLVHHFPSHKASSILFQSHAHLHFIPSIQSFHIQLLELLITHQLVQVFQSFFPKLEDQGWSMAPRGALSMTMVVTHNHCSFLAPLFHPSYSCFSLLPTLFYCLSSYKMLEWIKPRQKIIIILYVKLKQRTSYVYLYLIIVASLHFRLHRWIMVLLSNIFYASF